MISDTAARLYLKVACPTRKIHSSKLRQVRKSPAELWKFQTRRKVTGIGSLVSRLIMMQDAWICINPVLTEFLSSR